MGRPPCCDKANVKRGPWTPEEDAKILAHVASHGIGNWTLVPKKAGLNRCGKSCRLRWTNYLRPDLKHDNFTPEEEERILEFHKTVGSRWSLIAKQLPGRTDNDVKNYWNTKIKKKLIKMGIDPVTHKPLTQLFSELGKISGSLRTGNANPFLQNRADELSLNNQEMGSHPVENVAPLPEMVQPHFSNEASSSDAFSSPTEFMHFGCASSISYEPSQVLMVPSSSPSMSDEYMGMLSLNHDSVQVKEDGLHHLHSLGNDQCEYVEAEASQKCSSSDASSAADSFVEAILAHDNDMRLQFLNIWDESYEC